MPLVENVSELNRSNCVRIMLNSFQSNDVVKALIFMPGATDEFYMFRRGRTTLTNSSQTLLQAVIALTNQTFIRATFQPPFLLLHTDEDPLDLMILVKDEPTMDRIQGRLFLPHTLFNDNDWDFLLPVLKKQLRVKFSPEFHSNRSWHFYRHSFAGWNLDGWEALQAIAFAGKTKFTVERKHVIFEGDPRMMAQPRLDNYVPGR